MLVLSFLDHWGLWQRHTKIASMMTGTSNFGFPLECKHNDLDLSFSSKGSTRWCDHFTLVMEILTLAFGGVVADVRTHTPRNAQKVLRASRLATLAIQTPGMCWEGNRTSSPKSKRLKPATRYGLVIKGWNWNGGGRNAQGGSNPCNAKNMDGRLTTNWGC